MTILDVDEERLGKRETCMKCPVSDNQVLYELILTPTVFHNQRCSSPNLEVSPNKTGVRQDLILNNCCLARKEQTFVYLDLGTSPKKTRSKYASTPKVL